MAQDDTPTSTGSLAPAVVSWALLALSVALFYPAPAPSLALTAVALATSISFVNPRHPWRRRLLQCVAGWLAFQATALIVLSVLLSRSR